MHRSRRMVKNTIQSKKIPLTKCKTSEVMVLNATVVCSAKRMRKSWEQCHLCTLLWWWGKKKKKPQTSSKNLHPAKYPKQPSTEANDLVNYYIDETLYTSKAAKQHRNQQKWITWCLLPFIYGVQTIKGQHVDLRTNWDNLEFRRLHWHQ